jgi:hypothetical protein
MHEIAIINPRGPDASSCGTTKQANGGGRGAHLVEIANRPFHGAGGSMGRYSPENGTEVVEGGSLFPGSGGGGADRGGSARRSRKVGQPSLPRQTATPLEAGSKASLSQTPFCDSTWLAIHQLPWRLSSCFPVVLHPTPRARTYATFSIPKPPKGNGKSLMYFPQ